MRSGPLRHGWFATFTAAVSIGAIADEVARLALPLLVLDLTHSIGSAAALRVVQSVPYIVFGAPAGALIVIGFLLGSVEVLWGVTTDFSVVPALVEERELTDANAIYFAADRAARIIGPTLGGLAIAAIGNISAMWIAALAFLPTLALFWRMPPAYLASTEQSAPLTLGNVAREIADGFVFVWRLPILRWLLVVMSIANLGGVGLRTLLLYVLREEQHLDEVSIGLALSVSGGLTIIGSLIAPRLARGRPMGQSMIAVCVGAGVGALIAAGSDAWPVVLLGFTVREIAWQAFIIYAFIPRQRDVPARLRGRANGAFRTVVLVSNAASPALLSAIVVVSSSAAAFAAAGAFALAGAGVSFFTPLRRYAVREPAADDREPGGPSLTAVL